MTTPNHRAKIQLLSFCLILFCACSEPRKSEPAQSAVDYFRVDASTAGTITGKVFYSGKKPTPKKVDLEQDPQCAKLHQQAVYDEVIATSGANGKEQAAPLANVFVYIKAGLEDKNFEAAADPVVIDQKGCWFGPRVLGVQVGQMLKITNSDPVTHNIHPLAQINREWNQSQAPGAEAFTRKFTQPEVMIRVKCNIHNWMHAWVGVVAHPYFAVTGADGSFQLRNVPPGNYTLEVWHKEMGRQEQQITLAASGQSESIFNYKGE